MKINIAQLILTILLVFITLGLISFLSSCDASKQSVRHYNKFIKFGGVVTCDTTTDTLEVTIKGAGGKDSLIYVPVDFNCPDVTLPETNSQTRQKEKTKRTQIKEDGKTNQIKERKKPKVVRAENRHKAKALRLAKKLARIENNRWTFWDKLKFGISLFFVGLIVGGILVIVFFRRR